MSLTNYPAYLYIAPVAGDPPTITSEDDLSTEAVRAKYADQADKDTFASWGNGAHTGDYVQVGQTVVVRRNG